MAEPIIIVKEGSLEIKIRVPGGGGCDDPTVSPNRDEVVITWPRNNFKIDGPMRFKEVERNPNEKSVRIERA